MMPIMSKTLANLIEPDDGSPADPINSAGASETRLSEADENSYYFDEKSQ